MDEVLKLLLSNGGLAATILFIGLWQGWWYLAREYETLREDRDYYRKLAEMGTAAAERIASLTTRADPK